MLPCHYAQASNLQHSKCVCWWAYPDRRHPNLSLGHGSCSWSRLLAFGRLSRWRTCSARFGRYGVEQSIHTHPIVLVCKKWQSSMAAWPLGVYTLLLADARPTRFLLPLSAFQVVLLFSHSPVLLARAWCLCVDVLSSGAVAVCAVGQRAMCAGRCPRLVVRSVVRGLNAFWLYSCYHSGQGTKFLVQGRISHPMGTSYLPVAHFPRSSKCEPIASLAPSLSNARHCKHRERLIGHRRRSRLFSDCGNDIATVFVGLWECGRSHRLFLVLLSTSAERWPCPCLWSLRMPNSKVVNSGSFDIAVLLLRGSYRPRSF